MCEECVIVALDLDCFALGDPPGRCGSLSVCSGLALKSNCDMSGDGAGGCTECTSDLILQSWLGQCYQRSVPMKKRVASSGGGGESKPCHLAALDSPAFRLFPRILEHLAINRFEDGTPRLPGTVICRVESANWKVIAKEPSSQLQLVVIGATVDDAMAGLELLLGAEEAPWDDDPNAWQPKPRGRKSG